MNKILKKYILTVCVVSGSFVFGQFNTLMPTLPKKTENPKAIEKAKETDSPNPQKEKKSWKKIFNITTKTDLKNELDSLKTLLKENSNANNERKAHFEKIKDSLFLLAESIRKQEKQENREKKGKAPFGGLGAYMPLNREISVTSPFGTRIHPIFGATKFHNGIDLKANYENVYSVLDGIVTETGYDNKGGGNYIKIKHFNRFETAYLHLSEIYYRVGEFVKAGFIIAKSGNTGNSTGPHLHFSVKEFGQNINPTRFLNDLTKANHLMADYYKKNKNFYTQQ